MSIPGINVAFCFNNEAEAKNMAVALKQLSPEMNFITSSNFDGFLKAIAKADKIDFFIIEENYKECPAAEFITKLKASQRYKKSLISLFSTNQRNMDPKFLDFNLDYVFDSKSNLHDVCTGIENAVIKSLTPLIPEKFNILAVDDEAGILEMISMNLHELGHKNVDLCGSVLDAKKILNDKEMDLILLDWNLKDGTCLDIMDYIKNNPVSSRTKSALVMVITGRDSVDDIMTLLRYGVKDTIIKPFDFKEFEDKISYALEKHLKTPKT